MSSLPACFRNAAAGRGTRSSRPRDLVSICRESVGSTGGRRSAWADRLEICLGLDLCDSGFDSTVLSEFRTRLVRGCAEEMLFSTLIDKCAFVNLTWPHFDHFNWPHFVRKLSFLDSRLY